MMFNKFNRRILAGLLVVAIVCLGVFKSQVLSFFTSVINQDLSIVKTISDGFKGIYNSSKNTEEWLAHYCLYYPIYLSFHFLLINILFYDLKYLKKVIMLSLAGLLTVLILGKFIFGYFEATVMAEYFSFAFHKLVALPFILLAIEGGRQIWVIIQQSEKLNN